jgi:hypothetical protein
MDVAEYWSFHSSLHSWIHTLVCYIVEVHLSIKGVAILRVLIIRRYQISYPGREADHSPQTSAEMWIYTSTTPYAFMA